MKLKTEVGTVGQYLKGIRSYICINICTVVGQNLIIIIVYRHKKVALLYIVCSHW